MNLLEASLDDMQLLRQMYEHAALKWKEALRQIPDGTEAEAIAPVVAEIMKSSLPSDLKTDLAQCIHSKTEAVADQQRPMIEDSVPLPSDPDQGMLLRQSPTTSFSGHIEFEIHRFLRMKDYLLFECPELGLHEKLQYLVTFVLGMKLKLKEKATARTVALVNFLHENGGKNEISVNDSLVALAKFKLMLLQIEREGNTKGVIKLPRTPDDVDDLKNMCYETWSTMYEHDPPVPDRYPPEKLVLTYAGPPCRKSKTYVACVDGTQPAVVSCPTTKKAMATRSQIQSFEHLQSLQDILPSLSLFAQHVSRASDCGSRTGGGAAVPLCKFLELRS